VLHANALTVSCGAVVVSVARVLACVVEPAQNISNVAGSFRDALVRAVEYTRSLPAASTDFVAA
jgi:hypothetical protein